MSVVVKTTATKALDMDQIFGFLLHGPHKAPKLDVGPEGLHPAWLSVSKIVVPVVQWFSKCGAAPPWGMPE